MISLKRNRLNGGRQSLQIESNDSLYFETTNENKVSTERCVACDSV